MPDVVPGKLYKTIFMHFVPFRFILLKTIHSQQSQTVTIHAELDSKATKHQQLPASQEQKIKSRQ